MKFLKRLFCKHNFKWVANIYGDRINHSGGMRSEWQCVTCGKWTFRPSLEKGK